MEENIKVKKKSGVLVDFNPNKIKVAVSKSAHRVLKDITDDQMSHVINFIENYIEDRHIKVVDVPTMHNLVERALDAVDLDAVADSYRSYRNWKTWMAELMDKVYTEVNIIDNSGNGHENANTDEDLVTTKRCLKSNVLNSALYKQFFLTPIEVKHMTEGYYYIHDRSARLDTINCCLFDTKTVMDGGFKFGASEYTEPHGLEAAMSLLGDIISMSASNQYGGWSTRIDDLLAPYLEKSYNTFYDEYLSDAKDFGADPEDEEVLKKCHEKSIKRIEVILRQKFQALEMQLNTVASARGDFPFTTFAIGLGTKWSERLVSKWCLKVRMDGQGRPGHKRPMVFPKLVFLYDKDVHGPGKVNNDLFELALQCSSKCMYPDYLSLSGVGYVPEMYKRYKEIVYPMGCRAFLSVWWRKGGMHPADDTDTPVFTGRFNLGVISLNLPMIYMKAKTEHLDFYDTLFKFLEEIRGIHKRTIEFLGKKRASMDPLAFCEGGFYGGHLKPNDCIAPVLKSCTISFGITALDELSILHNGKSIRQDNTFAKEVMQYIEDYKNKITKEDNVLYAIYGTPAESLAGLQVKQFRKKFGVIKGVSDKGYFTNSFHCNVTEEMDGIEKQDKEFELFHMMNGGHIQYVRYDCAYNIDAMRTLVTRAMDMGFYEGVNFHQSFCEDCGAEFLGDECPQCGSKNITTIDRVCGYLGYTKVNGGTRMNASKLEEISDRKSM